MFDAVRQWTLLLVLTAFLLSVLVLGQIVTRYATAYLSAPAEVSAFLDTLDSSVEENESYDHNIARVPLLEDKLRLGRLLRDIQRAGDDLREDIGALLEKRPPAGAEPQSAQASATATSTGNKVRRGGGDDGEATDPSIIETKSGGGVMRARSSSAPDATAPSPRLRSGARFLWAARRAELSERVRRLDLLRMRFLVVYMSIVAATATAAAERVEKSAVVAASSTSSSPRDPEKTAGAGRGARTPPPMAPHLHNHHLIHASHSFPALGMAVPGAGAGADADGPKRTPPRPLRRLTTQAMGHLDLTEPDDSAMVTSPGGSTHRLGWADIVRELQGSPLMQKRHASIENAMRRDARSMTP